MYVTNASGIVQAYTINATTGALTSVGTTATGSSPYGVACDPTGKFVYVANISSNTVSAYTINASTGALTSVGTAATGNGPYGIACDPTGKFVYVVNVFDNTVQAYTINGITGALTSVGAVATGTLPYGVACDPTGKFVYVTNAYNGAGGNTVQAYTINAITGALTSVGTVATGLNPYGVACDPTGKFVYVTNYQSNNIYLYYTNIVYYQASQSKVFNLPVITQNNRVGFRNFNFDALSTYRPISPPISGAIKTIANATIRPYTFITKLYYWLETKSFWG